MSVGPIDPWDEEFDPADVIGYLRRDDEFDLSPAGRTYSDGEIADLIEWLDGLANP